MSISSANQGHILSIPIYVTPITQSPNIIYVYHRLSPYVFTIFRVRIRVRIFLLFVCANILYFFIVGTYYLVEKMYFIIILLCVCIFLTNIFEKYDTIFNQIINPYISSQLIKDSKFYSGNLISLRISDKKYHTWPDLDEFF